MDPFAEQSPSVFNTDVDELEKAEILAKELSAITLLPEYEFIGYEARMLAEADAWVGFADQIAAQYDPDSSESANAATIVFEIPLGTRVIEETRGPNGFLTVSVANGELFCDVYGSQNVEDMVFVMNPEGGAREPFGNNEVGRKGASEYYGEGVFSDGNIKKVSL